MPYFVQCRASMRPPEFTGGNGSAWRGEAWRGKRFNEAAGIHRRKPRLFQLPHAEQLALQ